MGDGLIWVVIGCILLFAVLAWVGSSGARAKARRERDDGSGVAIGASTGMFDDPGGR